MDKYQTYCAMREASVLKEIKHPNVLQLHDYYMDSEYICIVTDLM